MHLFINKYLIKIPKAETSSIHLTNICLSLSDI